MTIALPTNLTGTPVLFRFRLRINGPAGKRATQTASVLERAATRVAPVITAQPVSQSVASGAAPSFAASASGTPAPTVQWQLSTDGGSTWGNIAGATSATYSFTANAGENGYDYRAQFANAAGTATTNPATLTVTPATSPNWSGYTVTGATFTSVTGRWTVPTATCTPSQTAWVVQWVGIDGWLNNVVEQDGTAADCSSGTPSYLAWYEMYGDPDVNGGNAVFLDSSSYPVDPGDAMTADVSVTGGTWTLAISNTTQNWAFQIPIPTPNPAPPQNSAEWIVERPAVGSSLSSLADFGTASFTSAAADGNGQTGPISTFQSTAINMTGSSILAAPGSLNSTGDSFSVSWLGLS